MKLKNKKKAIAKIHGIGTYVQIKNCWEELQLKTVIYVSSLNCDLCVIFWDNNDISCPSIMDIIFIYF